MGLQFSRLLQSTGLCHPSEGDSKKKPDRVVVRVGLSKLTWKVDLRPPRRKGTPVTLAALGAQGKNYFLASFPFFGVLAG